MMKINRGGRITEDCGSDIEVADCHHVYSHWGEAADSVGRTGAERLPLSHVRTISLPSEVQLYLTHNSSRQCCSRYVHRIIIMQEDAVHDMSDERSGTATMTCSSERSRG